MPTFRQDKLLPEEEPALTASDGGDRGGEGFHEICQGLSVCSYVLTDPLWVTSQGLLVLPFL